MRAAWALGVVFAVSALHAGCGSRAVGTDAGLPWERDAGLARDGGLPFGQDAGAARDGGLPFGQDAGAAQDGGLPFGQDAGTSDAGVSDAGPPDAGALADAGTPLVDGGAADAGVVLDGGADAGPPDAGLPLELDAALHSTDLPVRVEPGTALRVVLEVTNTGTRAWAPMDFALASVNTPLDLWDFVATGVEAEVAPGGMARFSLDITAPMTVGRFPFEWQMRSPAGTFGPRFVMALEVTCDDGVFCNGAERFSGGVCVAGPPPCDDGVACTTDTCSEGNKTCAYALAASGCAACSSCVPSCGTRQCGNDGCGGSCGTCEGGAQCVSGACRTTVAPGTCDAPKPLSTTGTVIVNDDTTSAPNALTPSCAADSRAGEQVYTFTLTAPTVLDAQVSGFDSVLSLKTQCPAGAPTLACNDDSDPPGWPGSRIVRALEPGTYFLIVDGFQQAQGPYRLTARFLPGTCVPACDGKRCGPDGCGGLCGTCVSGACGADGRCADACARECDGKQCGTNSCGVACGQCGSGEICGVSGQCVPGVTCDPMRPTCSPACGDGQYCGNDCTCYDVNAPLPDLQIVQSSLRNGLAFETNNYRATACAVVEGCVAAPGVRRIMRFEVRAANIGQANLDLGVPSRRPERYQWSPCHRHYHFAGFAEYELRELSTSRVVVRGRKQAFCLEDITRVVSSPAVACNQRYTCSDQGIQRGWADVYSARLDCQWLDVTDVPPGRYVLSVRVNPERIIHEVTYDNNEASVEITIPAP